MAQAAAVPFAPASGPILPGEEGPGHKRYIAGAQRTVEPAETLARVRPLLASMQITRIADITGLDRIGIPVAVACRPNSRSLAVSQGKGISADAAKASAVMETIELFHAENIALPLRFGSREQLQSEVPLVEIEGLPLSANSTFNAQTKILWIEGYDLLQRQPVWLPYELVNTDFTLPFPAGSGYFQANSNGLASGNELLEAASQAICEVVERDALALWHASSDEDRNTKRVRIESIDDEACRLVLDKYDSAGIRVAVWDMTNDVGIACFRSTIAESTQDSMHVGYMAQGMGCHPSRGIALLRAMTEAAQSRLTYIAGSRDDVFRDMYMRLRDPDWERTRRRQLLATNGACDFRSAPDWRADTFRDDVAWELKRLRAVGVQRVIAVVLTKPELGIPVIKIVIPGMEGYVFSGEYKAGARASLTRGASE